MSTRPCSTWCLAPSDHCQSSAAAGAEHTTHRGPQSGGRENTKKAVMKEVVEVTLKDFQISFEGQSLAWCLHQAAEDMEANSFRFYRLESPALTPAP